MVCDLASSSGIHGREWHGGTPAGFAKHRLARVLHAAGFWISWRPPGRTVVAAGCALVLGGASNTPSLHILPPESPTTVLYFRLLLIGTVHPNRATLCHIRREKTAEASTAGQLGISVAKTSRCLCVIKEEASGRMRYGSRPPNDKRQAVAPLLSPSFSLVVTYR